MLKIINTVFSIVFFVAIALISYGGDILGDWRFALIPFVFASFIVIFTVNFLSNRENAKKRSAAIQRFAAHKNWTFNAAPAKSTMRILEHVRFYEGQYYDIHNFATGSYNNHKVATFDVHSSVSSGSKGSTTHHYYTVFGIQAADLNLPIFYLRQSGDSWLNLGEAFDIDFAHRPLFSQKFLLYSNRNNSIFNYSDAYLKDEHAVYRLFNDQVISFYENDNFGVAIAGGGNYLFIYTRSGTANGYLKPEQFDLYLNHLIVVYGLFREANRKMFSNAQVSVR